MRGGLQNLGSIAGYIVGAVVILPILLITYNYFFINKNNAGPYINSYIVNSQQIKIIVPPYTGDDIYQFKAITTALATKNMGRSDSRHTDMQFRVVYSPEIKGVDPMQDAFWRVVNKSTIIYAG